MSGPPYPAPAHYGDVAHLDAAGVPVTDGHFIIQTERVYVPATGAVLPTSTSAHEGGQRSGDFATDSFFDISYWDRGDTSEAQGFCYDTILRIRMQYTDLNDSLATLVPLDRSYPPGDYRRYFRIFQTGSSFSVQYRITYTAIDYETQTTTFDTEGLGSDAEPAELLTAGLDSLAGGGMFGTAGTGAFDGSASFVLVIRLRVLTPPEQCVPPDPFVPVFSLRQSAVFGTGPVSVEKRSWGAVKSLYR